MQKLVKFYFSLENYESAKPDFLEIEIKYDGYLIIIIDNIVSFLFVARIPDINIIKESNPLYHLKIQSVQ